MATFKVSKFPKDHYEPYLEDGSTPRCQAAVKNTNGEQCPKASTKKNNCHEHGGKSFGPPPGSLNNLKHGFYSSSYRQKIRNRSEILVDPKTLSEEQVRSYQAFLDDAWVKVEKHMIREEYQEAFGLMELINQTTGMQDKILNTIMKANEKDDPRALNTVVFVPPKAVSDKYRELFVGTEESEDKK